MYVFLRKTRHVCTVTRWGLDPRRHSFQRRIETLQQVANTSVYLKLLQERPYERYGDAGCVAHFKLRIYWSIGYGIDL
jgi:hypothetical protein